MVSRMTRGPANPMSAPGSAMLTSPSIANEAVTPPVVGWVRMDTKGSPRSASTARLALVLAICMSESAPSIMRAPPD